MSIRLRWGVLDKPHMSVINSGPKRKDYSDNPSYSYSVIGPEKHSLIIYKEQQQQQQQQQRCGERQRKQQQDRMIATKATTIHT